MEDFNLHLTGDVHAIGAAHNLAARVHRQPPPPRQRRSGSTRTAILWPRVVDISDRALRRSSIGLGGRENGYPRETEFVITVASEVMAVLALAMAVAGAGAEDVLPPGSGRPIHGTLLEELLRTNTTVYRHDMESAEFPEEDEFLALGLRCRLATPLLAGARAIGMLSLVRRRAERVHARGDRARRAARTARRDARCRTSARTRRNGRQSTSCAAFRLSAPTSSRSSRTSCAPRWRR